MKKSKERFVTQDEFTKAFNHAWQNEMNRCLYSGMLGYFEFGTEFDIPATADLIAEKSIKDNEGLKK